MIDPQLKMLVWKEWRERRGQLMLSLLLVGLCIFGALLWTASRHLRGVVPEQFFWEELAILYIFLVPVLVAMRTACGENTDHTGPFTRSLPLARGRASGIRLLGGAYVLAAPIALVAVLATINLVVARLVDPALPAKLPALMPADGWRLGIVWAEAAMLAIAAVGCYVQLALLGTLVERENELAFLGAVWTILCFFTAIGFAGRLEPVSPHSMLLRLSRVTREADPLPESARVSRAMAGNLAMIFLLSALFVSRHCQRIDGASQGSAWSRARNWLAAALPTSRVRLPWRLRSTRWGAIGWLAMRQSLPMSLAALGVALVISLMLLTVGGSNDPKLPAWKMALYAWAFIVDFIGILWASVVGVGSVTDELDRRSADFWRTRPIPFWRLFTIKFLVGMAVVAVVLDGPLLAFGELVTFETDPPDYAPTHWVYIACVLPVQCVMFAQALAWACLLRRVALGAMAAVCTSILVLLGQVAIPALQAFSPLSTYEELLREAKSRGGLVDLSTCGYPQLVALLALATLAAYFIAGYSLSTYQPRHPKGVNRTILRFPHSDRRLRLSQSA